MSNYQLPLEIEPLEEGGYLATSPALQGFLVQADTIEEIFELAPGVARALLEAMKEKGIVPPVDLQIAEPPFRADVLVAVP
jgi:predicted RNase H-like HicB family nuclease